MRIEGMNYEQIKEDKSRRYRLPKRRYHRTRNTVYRFGNIGRVYYMAYIKPLVNIALDKYKKLRSKE